MVKEDYAGRALHVLSPLLSGFSREELSAAVRAAYASFDTPSAAPLQLLDEKLSVMELFHGPTCAFKDVALQLLPHLMRMARTGAGIEEDTLILTATSGDTGKAAMEGFAGAEGIKILVYYPQDGVSTLQKLQMMTQQGDNVGVFGVNGVFDDAQTGVKRIFTDPEMIERLKKEGYLLSSANSINFGRLAPQIVYYFTAWCDLYAAGRITEDEKVDFIVPTGNFGDILAGYYAARMGLPVGRLVCASNENRVLTDFFATGLYDARRPFYTTSSPSMDILISSNLERLLFEACGRNAEAVSDWMASLSGDGSYQVDEATLREIRSFFDADCADTQQTAQAIRDAFARYHYCMDPHTAVGYSVYTRRPESDRQCVLVSTASPYKFLQDVLEALTGSRPEGDDPFAWMAQLEAVSGMSAPRALKDLSGKEIRFTEVLDKENMPASVLAFLGLD